MDKANNETGHFISAVTLDYSWPKQYRLSFIISVTIVGAMMNGFFAGTIIAENYLKRIGYVFKACTMLSDMIVCMIVLPAATAVLLSEHGDTPSMCYTLQFMIEASTYCYNAFFAMMSVENYCRIYMTADKYEVSIPKRIVIIILLTTVASFTTAGVGVYLALDYDYCYRKHSGNTTFRVITFFIFHLIPGFITLYTLVGAWLVMKRRANNDMHYRNSLQYKNDRNTNYVDIVAFILYASSWMTNIINGYSAARDPAFYQSLWIGIARSVVTSVIYGLMDKVNRKTFVYYCCCKVNISSRMLRRRRRDIEDRAAAGMMLDQMRANSPRRAVLTPREAQF